LKYETLMEKIFLKCSFGVRIFLFFLSYLSPIAADAVDVGLKYVRHISQSTILNTASIWYNVTCKSNFNLNLLKQL
jgi:hypothetical protein